MPTALSPTANKLAQLRQRMTDNQLHAFVVPSGDDFLNEYVPTHLNRRQWLSGFTGSAGDMVISATDAVLFVDGRYHEQVDSQIDTSVIRSEKLGTATAKSLTETLIAHAAKHTSNNAGAPYRVGVPATCVSQAAYQRWQQAVGNTHHVHWVPITQHPADAVWEANHESPRPQWQPSPWRMLSDEVAGQSAADKLTTLRSTLAKHHATVLPITATDEVAWLLNIRADDIPHTPVALAMACVTPQALTVFMAKPLLDDPAQAATRQHIQSLGGTCQPLGQFYPALQQLATLPTTKPWLDAANMPAAVFTVLGKHEGAIKRTSPIHSAKAVKNNNELYGMRQAHLAASVALCTVWYQLHTALQQQQPISEADVSQWIEAAYRQHPACTGLSFPSIVGTGENGAIVHYGTPNPKRLLQPGELVLFDSGAQYCSDGGSTAPWMGTTDTTRTIVVGTTPSEKQRHRYTLVLKSHIACAMQRFPKGTNGIQIDAIGRSALWQQGLDFMHGTGHGVGCYLGVHEGPIGISKGYSTAFTPGMITSIEPGYYESGWGGIRLENLVEVIETPEHPLATTGDPMLAFKPLIYVPFDTTLIDATLLTQAEQGWLNDYHAKTLAHMNEQLTDSTLLAWLSQRCQAITS